MHLLAVGYSWTEYLSCIYWLFHRKKGLWTHKQTNSNFIYIDGCEIPTFLSVKPFFENFGQKMKFWGFLLIEVAPLSSGIACHAFLLRVLETEFECFLVCRESIIVKIQLWLHFFFGSLNSNNLSICGFHLRVCLILILEKKKDGRVATKMFEGFGEALFKEFIKGQEPVSSIHYTRPGTCINLPLH